MKEKNENKKVENELFTAKPSLRQFYGRTVKEGLEFDEYTDNKEVHQVMKDGVLTTEINREYEIGGIKVTRYEKMVEVLPVGTILIWSEKEGYVVPNVPFYKLEDLKEEIREIEDIYKEV